jgi:hypothetical protein
MFVSSPFRCYDEGTLPVQGDGSAFVSNICVCSSSVFRDPLQVATGASLGGCAENHDDYDFLGSLLTPVCYWSMGKRGPDGHT